MAGTEQQWLDEAASALEKPKRPSAHSDRLHAVPTYAAGMCVLRAGLDVNVRNGDGATPLHAAARNGRMEVRGRWGAAWGLGGLHS